MILINERLPKMGRIVICYRKWVSQSIVTPGLIKTEIVLASRDSDNPLTINEDTSINCWWNGYNEKAGHSWSDSTVIGWDEVINES